MAKFKYYNGGSWIELLADAGASPNLNNGSVVTQPQGDNALSIKTNGTASDTGIFYLSEDASYVCNSGDCGYVFAVFDKDVTQDFSSANNAAFAIYQSSAGAIMKGDLTVGGSITSAGNTVITSANIGSYAITSLSGYATQDWVGTYYLGINNKAADSDKLDGNDSSYFINTSNIGSQNVNYANSAGSANYTVQAASSPNNALPQTGVRSFYSWNAGNIGNSSEGYCVGFTIGSHPSDQNYGFQIAENLWNDRLYTRRYNDGWNDWYAIAYVSDIPTNTNQLTNGAGFITGIDSSMVINALGYTPANSSSLSNYLPTSGGTITNSGSPLLTLKRNTNGGAFIGFKSSNQDTYIWYNGSTSSNALRFSYSSDGGATSTKKMELDNSGNLEVVGSISEAGTGLSSKYLGINSTAANSSKLNNQEASYYLNYNNLSNKPTIPTADSGLSNDRYVRFDTASQGLNDTQKSNARTNIGALPSNTSYGYSLSISGTSLSLKNQNGTTLSTVTIPSSGGGGGSLYKHCVFVHAHNGQGPYEVDASFDIINNNNGRMYDLDYLIYMMSTYYHADYGSDEFIPASGYFKDGSYDYIITGVSASANQYKLYFRTIEIGGATAYRTNKYITALDSNLEVLDNLIQIQ